MKVNMSREGPQRNFIIILIISDIQYRIYRAQVGDPRRFIGKRISKKCSSDSWKKGDVIKISNMEGINTMYQVEWVDGTLENLRIIEDYLNDLVLLDDEEHRREMDSIELMSHC